MSNPITSHANCQHASTKPERAKCRRQRAKFGDVLAQIFEEKTAATYQPTELEANYDRVIAAADDLVAKMEADEAAAKFISERVTADTWRDFKETTVRIATQIDDDAQSEIATGVKITGWGKQWINYINDEGKTKRTAGNAYVRVTTVES